MSQSGKFFETRTNYDQVGDVKTQNFGYHDIGPSVNSILNTVHQRLKYNPKPSVPKIPRAIADTMPRRLNEVLLMETPKRKKESKNFLNQSIHKLQADRELKNLTQARRFGATSDMMSFPNQKRYRELLCQKRLLEEMLKEHQKLQSDRDNIASEISYMRSYLDTIRNKLDVSLRKLNTQKTLPRKENDKLSKSQPNLRHPPCLKNNAQSLRSAAIKNRISGGSENLIKPNRISHVTNTKKIDAHKVNVKEITKAKKPAQPKGPKQWVYCSRVDRNDFIKSVFI